MSLFNENRGNGPTTNGYSGQNSPNSSQMSAEGQDATLISRTQKQHTTQQVCEFMSQPEKSKDIEFLLIWRHELHFGMFL